MITFVLLISGLWACFISEQAESVAGSITSNINWSGHVNVTGDVYIEDGVKLTVLAGTTVEFRGNYGIYLAPNATLDVQGTSGNEVIFFNYTQWNWKGIYLNTSSSTAWFNYSTIFNCVDGISANSSGNLDVRNSTINNSVFGIQGESFDPLVENSHFHNCSYPLFLVKANGSVIHNEFHNNTNKIIWLNSRGQPDFDNNIVKNTGVSSGSNAVEFSDTNVHFTNNTIDSAGGHGVTFSHCSAYVYKNTIINNGLSTGEAGVYVWAGFFKDTTIITNNNISSNYDGLVLDRNPGQPESSVLCTVKDNDIHHNLNAGVVVSNWSAPEFQRNDVHNNSYGIKAFQGDPVIANSSIVNNAVSDFYVVYYGRPVSLNTRYNTVSVTANRPEQYLKVIWFLHVKVINKTSKLPITGIEIKVSSMATPIQYIHIRSTDAAGETKFMHIEERVIYNAATTITSPFQITALDTAFQKAYVKNKVTNYNLPSSRTLIIELDPNQAPTTPLNIRPTTSHKTQYRLQWDASTEPNGEKIYYYYKFGTSSGFGDLIPETMTTQTYLDIMFTLVHNYTYFLCVKAGDESGLNSSWSCAGIHIENVHPSAPVITANPDNIFTDTSIDINMTAQSFDDPDEVANFGERIKYSVKVTINDAIINKYTKLFVWARNVNFTINSSDFGKGDYINVTLTPYDGHGSAWNVSEGLGNNHTGNGTSALLNLRVSNHPPEIEEQIGDIDFDEDTIYTFPKIFTEIFSDPDDDKLTFVSKGTQNINISYNKNTKEIKLIPAINYFSPAKAADQIVFGADDGAGGITNITLNVTVKEVNDPPLIHILEPQIAYQGKKHYINITTTDPADPHDASSLTIKTDYSNWTFSSNVTLVTHSSGNISLYFTPSNNDIGDHNLTISANDTKTEVVKKVVVKIKNVNDKPGKIVLMSPRNSNGKVNQIYNTSDDINFQIDVSDPDEMWGDELKVLWRSNISGLTIGNKFDFISKISLGGHHRITITVTDLGGLSTEIYFDVFVVPRGIEFPRTELVYPIDTMVFPSMTPTKKITLKWEPMKHKYSDLFVYNLEYWEDEPSSKSTKINGLTETEFDLTATVEKRYYWWVIPTLGGPEGVTGECFSGKWHFNVKFVENITTPSVELWNPISTQTINGTSLELEWKPRTPDSENYFYQLYMDENPLPSTLIKDYITNIDHTITGLKDKTTYYWDIIPIYGDVEGSSTNGPFSFYVDLDFIPVPEVEFTGDPFELDMLLGEKGTFTYSVKNKGNTHERITISVDPDNILADKVTGYEDTELMLSPGESEDIEITVDLSDLGEGTYNIKLRVVSEDWDLNEQPEITINAREKKENYEPPWILFILIIIIIIVVILLLYLQKRGGPKIEGEEEATEDVTADEALPESPETGHAELDDGPERIPEQEGDPADNEQLTNGSDDEEKPEELPPKPS
jgi:hypothetical protein